MQSRSQIVTNNKPTFVGLLLVSYKTKHLRWFSMTFQDLTRCVEVLVFLTQSTLPLRHIVTEHCNYKLLRHLVSNVPVVTNANELQMSVINS